MRDLIMIVFDSARWDAFAAARTPVLDRLARVQHRWSFASWTAPAHMVFLMGLLPHENRTGTLASVQYRSDLVLWNERLGLAGGVEFRSFLPALSLPAFLRRLGYRCEAHVSLPVLNGSTLLAAHFDTYTLMPSHNDLGAIVNRLEFGGGPRFHFINTGETHYPYLLPGESDADLPHLPGVNGVWRTLDEFLRDPARALEGGLAFNVGQLRPLWTRQVRAIEYLDGVVGRLCEAAPRDAWFIVLSDHGELFGEDGFFGHGPIVHEKVFEVFVAEGLNPLR